MVSPLQRNSPEIIGLMGAGLLLFQYSKYIPIMKTNKWVQNIALRINTRFSFAPAALLSSGIFWGVGNRQVESLNRQLEEARSDSAQIREQLTRVESERDQSSRQVEDLSGQLTNAQVDSAQMSGVEITLNLLHSQLIAARTDNAMRDRQVESLNRQLEEARSDSAQITRAQTANAESARQVESLNRQPEEARSDSAQISEQLTMAQSDSARLSRQLKGDLIISHIHSSLYHHPVPRIEWVKR